MQNKKIPPLGSFEYEALNNEEFQGNWESVVLNKGLSEDELKRLAMHAEHNRKELFLDHFERIFLMSVYLVWFILIILGLTWAYHLVAPETWYHLPKEQVDQIGGIITGGLLGFLGTHFKNRLAK